MDHPHYRYSALPSRPASALPPGLHVFVVLYLEHWAAEPASDQVRDPRFVGEFGSFSPDYRSWTQREYGLRIGVFRLIEALAQRGIRPTVAANALVLDRVPEVLQALQSLQPCWIAHGLQATELMHTGMDRSAQAKHIEQALQALQGSTGVQAAGWLSQDWGTTPDTYALLADAGHNLSDVAGLMLAWAAHAAGQLPPSQRRSFGWRKASILAGALNGLVLAGVILGLAYEAFERFQSPEPVQSVTVIGVALAGVLVNGLTAALFASGRRHDLNIRGAFLHMAADALVSLGVALAGLLTLWQGWVWLDPMVTLLILAVILAGTWSLLRQSLHLMLDGVPEDIDLLAVKGFLQDLPGVQSVHGLHVWGLSTRENALMAHLVCASPAPDLLEKAGQGLALAFGLRHVTLQIEAPDQAEHCHLAQAL